MEERTNLVVVGGFLGAGKTSLISKLTMSLQSSGERVVVITNDQGANLIDTNTIARAGVTVTEVTGGCFCCKFHELESVVQQVLAEKRPSWIVAEAVGSCTDLVATVMRPMRRLHRLTVSSRPVSIVIDPVRAFTLLGDDAGSMSDEVVYLYKQQICEADLILLNKSDVTSGFMLATVTDRIRAIHPTAAIIPTSAVTCDGLEAWRTGLTHSEARIALNPLAQLDYDIYADAEAQLGWVNLRALLECTDGFISSEVVRDMGSTIHDKLAAEHYEIAHVKLLGLSAEGAINGSITSTGGNWRWSDCADGTVSHATLLVNARVCAPPEVLSDIVVKSVHQTCRSQGIGYSIVSQEAFRPSRPTPEYREV